MKILTLDSAMTGCSVAFWDVLEDQGAFLADALPRGQAERLIPMVLEVLVQAGAGFSDVDCVGVTRGPGAFTGLRVGLAAARALGLAMNKPVIGVTTLEVLCAQALAEVSDLPETLTVLIETKRRDFYVQTFGRDSQPLDAPSALTGEEIFQRLKERKTLFTGDAVERFRGFFGDRWPEGWDCHSGNDRPDPRTIARVCAGKTVETPPEPLYLRGADVSLPKEKFS